jgi:hypothetical protein
MADGQGWPLFAFVVAFALAVAIELKSETPIAVNSVRPLSWIGVDGLSS